MNAAERFKIKFNRREASCQRTKKRNRKCEGWKGRGRGKKRDKTGRSFATEPWRVGIGGPIARETPPQYFCRRSNQSAGADSSPFFCETRANNERNLRRRVASDPRFQIPLSSVETITAMGDNDASLRGAVVGECSAGLCAPPLLLT